MENLDQDDVVEVTRSNLTQDQPPKVLSEQPGGLRNTTTMTIQTKQAQKLVTGRRRSKGVSPITGLLDFGSRTKLLWLSSESDDPYADWYLLQIEESINESRAMIKEKKQWLDEVLKSMEGFNIEVAHSLQPIQVSLYFQNPFGYIGAYLVSDYDALACSIFTARHLGLIDRAMSESIIHSVGKSIRRTFALVTEWKFTGVTREDIKQDNQSAKRALETYGDCPPEVLSKDKRARMAPAIRVKVTKDNGMPNEVSDQLKPTNLLGLPA